MAGHDILKEIMNFGEPHVLAHYEGSWVKVQVAFYDFLHESLQMTPKEYQEAGLRAVVHGEYRDGEEFFEDIAARIRAVYPTPETAWEQFLAKEFTR